MINNQFTGCSPNSKQRHRLQALLNADRGYVETTRGCADALSPSAGCNLPVLYTPAERSSVV